MSESCSASSSSIVVGSGPRSRTGAGSGSSSSAAAAGASAVSSSLRLSTWPVPSRSRSARRRRPTPAQSPRPRSPSRRWPAPSRRLASVAAATGSLSAATASGSVASAASATARIPPLGRRRRSGRLGYGLGRSRALRSRVGDSSAGGGLRGWLRGRLGGCSAGSSATATAVPTCSGAWSVSGALASGSGAVPPCFSSVKGYVAPVRSKSPRMTTAWAAPRPSETMRRWSVVDLGRGPLPSAKLAWTCLQLCCLPEPGESSTRFLAATIGRPCPNCPTSRSSPRHSTLRSSAARSSPSPPPGRSPCGARRPSSRHLSGSASPTSRAAASSSSSTPTATGSSSTRCSPAGSSSPARARSCRRRRRSCCRSARARLDRSDRPPGRKRADWMPADDAPVEVRYRDPTQMGKVYLLPAGLERTVPGLADGDLGPDADDPALTLDVWRQRIRRHPGELKNLLKNQALHGRRRQRLQRRDPPRRAPAAVPEAIGPGAGGGGRALRGDALDAGVGDRRPSRRVPPTFEKQVRDFLAVHDKGGQAVPRCGTKITRGEARRLRDVVLPRLPALTGAPLLAALRVRGS